MFRRKKKEEAVEPVLVVEAPVTAEAPEALAAGEGSTSPDISEAPAEVDQAPAAAAEPAAPCQRRTAKRLDWLSLRRPLPAPTLPRRQQFPDLKPAQPLLLSFSF